MDKSPLTRIALVGVASMACAWLGLLTPALGAFVSLFWPPAGLALASLLRWHWPAAIGVLTGVAAIAILQGASPALACSLAAANLIGPSIAAWGLRRLHFRPDMARRRDLASFVLLGVALGPGISALAGALILLGFGHIVPAEMPRALLSWWGGDALGVLSLGVPLLVLPGLPARPRTEPGTPARRTAWLASGLLAFATLGSAALVFGLGGQNAVMLSPWLFAPHLLLSWLTLRDGLTLASVTAALLTLLAALSTGVELGPFAAIPLPERLATLWAYTASAAAVPLLANAVLGEMRQEHSRWRHALEAAGMGIASWDLVTGEHRASPAWQGFVGTPALQPAAAPTAWLEAVHAMDRVRLLPMVNELLTPHGQAHISETLRLRREGGDWLWFELRMHVEERDARGLAQRLVATLADVTWKRTAEERERMSVSLFQHLHEGLLITDTDGVVLDANPSYCRIMAQAREALLGQRARPLLLEHLRRSGHSPEQLQQALQAQGHWQGLVSCTRHDGSTCELQLTVSTMPEPEGPARFQVIAVSDMTEQLRRQALLERQRQFDELTGLPNRSEFLRRLELALASSEQQGFMLCVCHLDLDNFAQLAETEGEARANAALRALSQSLQGALRSAEQWSDQLARIGGDEFALLLRCDSLAEARLATERMLNVLRLPIYLDEHSAPLTLTASLGASLFPLDRSSAETLMRHAGHALYRVKRAGRNACEFFDTEKRLRKHADGIAMGRMQEALDGGELQLHYQPKVDMRRGRVLGFEALLRWQHPERGLLMPGLFLPLVERTGLGVQIGDWVLEQAMRQSAQWLAQGLQLRVSVNVTARHLQTLDFTQRLRELLARHPEPIARHLMLEVLESAALADVDATHRLIQDCKALGVSFALDDFGTGYSTLTYLKRLPVDALKIDRSFVQNMLIDPHDQALVEGVIGLAKTFGCSVVAEGVESDAHARALLAAGCELGQGSGIAHAMPAERVPEWVAAFEQAPSFGGRRAAAGATKMDIA